MKIVFFHVDAFAGEIFRGNPAALYPRGEMVFPEPVTTHKQ